jgi:hypothetical protein
MQCDADVESPATELGLSYIDWHFSSFESKLLTNFTSHSR